MYLKASDDVDSSALEADFAVGGREKRIVPAHTDVVAGEELGPALPDDDRCSKYAVAR